MTRPSLRWILDDTHSARSDARIANAICPNLVSACLELAWLFLEDCSFGIQALLGKIFHWRNNMHLITQSRGPVRCTTDAKSGEETEFQE